MVGIYASESLSISLQISGRNTVLTSVYVPQYKSTFKEDLITLSNKTNDAFIFGDLNAQYKSWNCSNNNAAGNILFNYQNQTNLYVYYPPNPTRFGQNSTPTTPSTVDILISNSYLPISDLETHPDALISDHVPITCHIYGSIAVSENKFPLYHLADWPAIRTQVDSEIRSQIPTEDIGESF